MPPGPPVPPGPPAAKAAAKAAAPGAAAAPPQQARLVRLLQAGPTAANLTAALQSAAVLSPPAVTYSKAASVLNAVMAVNSPTVRIDNLDDHPPGATDVARGARWRQGSTLQAVANATGPCQIQTAVHSVARALRATAHDGLSDAQTTRLYAELDAALG